MAATGAGGVLLGPDGRPRCPWAGTAEDYRRYHDEEWGVPVRGEAAVLERLVLEAFQSGLSWLTILRKRPAFRVAFAGFDPARVAAFGSADLDRLMADRGIVRNRAKIEAAVANARAALAVPGGLSALFWSYAPPAAGPAPRTVADIPAATPESTALSYDLRARGFRFLGPTTLYAAMQACGLVDDHLAGCCRRGAAEPGARH